MLKIKAPTTVTDLMDKVEAKTGVKFYFSARSEKSTKLRGTAPCPATGEVGLPDRLWLASPASEQNLLAVVGKPS